MTNDERDQLRASVLQTYYESNDEAPGRPIRAGDIAQHLNRDQTAVAGAVLYLADPARNLLEVTNQQHSTSSKIPSVHAHITADGIDIIEHPERNGPGRLEPSVIQHIVVNNAPQISGATVYHNSQHVGGANHGTMVNASQTGDIVPPATPFPIEQLRAMIPNGTPARDAAEALASESLSPNPLISRITGAMETLKAGVVSAEAGQAVIQWLHTPDVAQWYQHLAMALTSR